jgi:hypothetical protein
MLYASLYFIVKRADRIIFLQSMSLKRSMEKIEEKTAELDVATSPYLAMLRESPPQKPSS